MKIECLLTVACLLCGCAGNSGKNGTETGSDRDEHGCIASAGYVWSEVRQDCIRPFETGVKLVSVTPADSGAVYAAYMVFSTDSSRVELFLPGQEETDVLDRRALPGGEIVWSVENDDAKNVRMVDGEWVVEQQGKTLYIEDIYPIYVTFVGTDGKTEQAYRVEVVFERDLARVTFDGTVFDLPQYVTGSGYGYGNQMMDLRGKGSEAVLTITDGPTLTLVEE